MINLKNCSFNCFLNVTITTFFFVDLGKMLALGTDIGGCTADIVGSNKGIGRSAVDLEVIAVDLEVIASLILNWCLNSVCSMNFVDRSPLSLNCL